MSYRIDANPISTLEPHQTTDGILLCDAVFARDGVLTYHDPNTGKTRRELRLPEENQKAIAQFGLASLTQEHPSQPLSRGKAADRLRKGITLANPTYEVVQGKGGFVKGQIAILDSAAQDAVKRGDCSELSAGYQCRIDATPGEWTNPATGLVERYDSIQRDIQVNHVALTKYGRAGPAVGVQGRFDSADDDPDFAYQVFPESTADRADRFDTQPSPIPMTQVTASEPLATISVPGGSMSLPQGLMGVISPLAARADSLERTNSTLEAQLTDAEDRADSAQELADFNEGKVAGLEQQLQLLSDRLDTAEDLLAEQGIEFRGDSYYRVDAKSKRKAAPLEDLEDMDDDDYVEDMDDEDMDAKADMDEDMDDEDMPPFLKKKLSKGKKTKKDGGSYKKDSLQTMLAAITEAAALGVDVSDRLDSLSSPADIHRLVVAERLPDADLEGRSDAAISGMYEVLKLSPAPHADYTQELSGVLGARRDSVTRNDAQAKDNQRRQDNWKK